VARGEADRRSDIDLWVLTRSGRAESQREANAIARDLEDTEFDGDRYAYDIDVEAVQAIPAYTEDIREIVVQGFRSTRRMTSKPSRTSSWRKGPPMSNGSDPTAVLAALDRAQDAFEMVGRGRAAFEEGSVPMKTGRHS